MYTHVSPPIAYPFIPMSIGPTDRPHILSTFPLLCKPFHSTPTSSRPAPVMASAVQLPVPVWAPQRPYPPPSDLWGWQEPKQMSYPPWPVASAPRTLEEAMKPTPFVPRMSPPPPLTQMHHEYISFLRTIPSVHASPSSTLAPSIASTSIASTSSSSSVASTTAELSIFSEEPSRVPSPTQDEGMDMETSTPEKTSLLDADEPTTTRHTYATFYRRLVHHLAQQQTKRMQVMDLPSAQIPLVYIHKVVAQAQARLMVARKTHSIKMYEVKSPGRGRPKKCEPINSYRHPLQESVKGLCASRFTKDQVHVVIKEYVASKERPDAWLQEAALQQSLCAIPFGGEFIFPILAVDISRRSVITPPVFGSLDRLLQMEDTSSISMPRRVALANQLVRAVDHMHSQKLVHGDIGLHNVLVYRPFSKEVRCYLNDFSWTRPQSDPWTTDRKELLCDPAYAAPELVRWTEDGASSPPSTYSVASDVYALAICIISILSMKRPFGETTDVSTLLHEVALGTRPSIPMNWPSDLYHSLVRAMDGNPSKRGVALHLFIQPHWIFPATVPSSFPSESPLTRKRKPVSISRRDDTTTPMSAPPSPITAPSSPKQLKLQVRVNGVVSEGLDLMAQACGLSPSSPESEPDYKTAGFSGSHPGFMFRCFEAIQWKPGKKPRIRVHYKCGQYSEEIVKRYESDIQSSFLARSPQGKVTNRHVVTWKPTWQEFKPEHVNSLLKQLGSPLADKVFASCKRPNKEIDVSALSFARFERQLMSSLIDMMDLNPASSYEEAYQCLQPLSQRKKLRERLGGL